MVNDKLFVSVLMSVYSEKPEILQGSIDSILNQTFQNFEFLIYLDNPDNEELWRFLTKYAQKDSRLVIHKNEVNRSLAGTLNDELKVAKGDYIVRMDGDDISIPNRIELLVDYMEGHPEVGVASSWMKEFGNKKSWKNKTVKYTSDFFKMELMLLYQTPIAHAPCIIRRSVVDSYSPLYNEKCCRTQDYELWSRLVKEGVKLGMVPQPLYLRRKSGDYGPKPINFRIIHNQIARHNIGVFLSNYKIELPAVIDDDFIANIHRTYKKEQGQNKKKLKTIAAVAYSTKCNTRMELILSLIKNKDLNVPFVLPFNLALHLFVVPGLFNINNLVTDDSQLIF